SEKSVRMGHQLASAAVFVSARLVRSMMTRAIAVSTEATQTGASSPSPVASPSAPSTGPAAAPIFNAAVAYEPPIVGAPDAAYSTRVIRVLPTPNDRNP